MVDKTELNDLYAQRRVAEDKYLELRDAKSDGCCHDLPIYKILQYDDKIMAARAEIDRIDELIGIENTRLYGNNTAFIKEQRELNIR